MKFALLLVSYLIIETFVNATLLVVKWYFDKECETNQFMILVELASSLPVRITHSILNAGVIYIVMNAMKRKGHLIDFIDARLFLKKLTNKVFFGLLLSDVVISSPLAVSQVLKQKDSILSLVYYIFGFFLNWLFGFTPILILEDSALSITTTFVWCTHSAFSPQFFNTIFINNLLVYCGAPLIVIVPFLIIFQLITFYDIFGFSSASEVHLATED